MRRIVAILGALSLALCSPAWANNGPGPPQGGAQSSTGSGGLTGASADCSVTNSCLFVAVGSADNIVTFGVSGTFTGTIIIEGTADGTTWNAITSIFPFGSATSQANITAIGVYQVAASGLVNVRARCSVLGSGNPVITEQASNATVANGVGGAASVSVSSLPALPAGTNTIGGINLIANAATNNLVRTQLDFTTGGASANCQPATVYDGSTAPTQVSTTQCYIIKASAGVLYGVEWNSGSNMTALTAGVLVTCYDKATTGAGTGNNIVWQGQLGAGQFANLPAYGIPFKIGLECAPSAAIASSSISFFELWTK